MCPYCSNHGFIADETYSPDSRVPEVKPDAYRWLNRCSTCKKWSVWIPGEGQKPIPDPDDPESLK